jgi:hypothetical protein
LQGAQGTQGIQGQAIQGTTGATSNAFTTIATPAGTSPVADSYTDTLTLTAGTGITITGNSTTDTVDIAVTANTYASPLLDFSTISTSQTISDATYVGKTLYCTNSSAITITVNNDSSTISLGAQISIIRAGTGSVTVVDGTATVNATPGQVLRAQYSMATLIKVVDNTTDVWMLVGDISA